MTVDTVIGVDVGTSSVRAGATTRADDVLEIRG
jgi:ribulose kinase